jgi:hypothetical protein
MEEQPNYRRRRLGVVIAALALLVVANHHDRPTFGVLAIGMGEDHRPQVSAEWAPTMEAIAMAVAAVAAEIAADR